MKKPQYTGFEIDRRISIPVSRFVSCSSCNRPLEREMAIKSEAGKYLCSECLSRESRLRRALTLKLQDEREEGGGDK